MFQRRAIKLGIFLFSALFFLFAKADEASSNTMTLNTEKANFFSNIRYQSADFEFDKIIHHLDGWKNITSSRFNAGFSSKAYWLKHELKNPTENKEWFLTLDNTRLDFVDFYLISADEIQHLPSGDYRPISKQLSSNPTFKFYLPSKKTAQLYIRVKSESKVAFSPQIRSSFVYGQYHLFVKSIHVFYVFILLFFIVLQVYLTKQIANKVILYYTASLIFGFAYNLFYFGEGNLLFWPDNSTFKNRGFFVFALIFCAFFSLFLKQYFRTSIVMPLLHTLLSWYLIFTFISLTITLFSVSNFVRVVLVLLVAISLVFFTLACIIKALQKNKLWALWPAIPLLLTMVALFFYVFTFLGLLPYTMVTSQLVLWSVPFDLLLISISFVFRHSALQNEHSELLVKLDNIAKQYNGINTDDFAEKTLSDNIAHQDLNNRLNNINTHTSIIKLIQYLDNDQAFLNPNLNVEDVACIINVRSDQLSTLINSELNTSFPKLINIKRLKMAAQLLKENPNKNIIDIALECGFNSKSNFNRLFKEYFDTTPTRYRKV